ncbi:MAG: complement resistance protein TraT [Pseudomonadota bacterium]|nr:complement resistance protein TraT [Pseudomonadota bacterium]
MYYENRTSIYPKVKGNSWRSFGLLTALAGIVFLGGCAAIHTSVAKKDLNVQTRMSDTIFLDPAGSDKKSIFVQIRNTSDKQNFNVQDDILISMSDNI